ncbi:MAG: tetratricopeptide repeat protein [Gammaproteobacteria bacterium]|nr:tetratricopeptide repeat protein [Gammaproteobacteria bacterium]
MAVELYDDMEQAERVKQWLRDNGSGIVIGLLLAFGGIFGFRYWQQYQMEQNLGAATQYNILQQQLPALDSAAEPAETASVAVEQAASKLKQDYADNLYAALASLQLADQHINDGALQAAVAELDFVIQGSEAGYLGNIAKLRKARVLIALEQPDAALQLLDTVVDPQHYAALIARTRGEAYLAKGDNEQALAAFETVETELGGTPDRLVALRLQALQEPDIDALLEQAGGSFANQPANMPANIPPELLQQLQAAPDGDAAADGGDDNS